MLCIAIGLMTCIHCDSIFKIVIVVFKFDVGISCDLKQKYELEDFPDFGS